MSKDEAFFTWYEGMIRTIEDAHPFAELSFFHDHRTACKAAWDARSALIPKLPEDVAGLVAANHRLAELVRSFGEETPEAREADNLVYRPAEALTAQAARIAELEGVLFLLAKDRHNPPHSGKAKTDLAALGETDE